MERKKTKRTKIYEKHEKQTGPLSLGGGLAPNQPNELLILITSIPKFKAPNAKSVAGAVFPSQGCNKYFGFLRKTKHQPK